jgi:arylformamidase
VGVILDLSVVVDATTVGPPAAGSPPVSLETAFRGPGHWQSSRIAALLHTGSHVDAPLHVVAGGRSIESVTLEELSGIAVVIDVHDAAEREPLDAARLKAATPEIPPGSIVAVRTDWTDRWWGTFPDYYTRSPFLTEDAGIWLTDLRPKAIVVDFFEEECAVSTDFTSEDFVVHRALLGRDIPIVEQATRLGEAGSDPFLFRAPFVLLAGVEAAPCRIYAELPDGD